MRFVALSVRAIRLRNAIVIAGRSFSLSARFISTLSQIRLSTTKDKFDGSAEKSAIAADRNKQPILEVLQKYIDQSSLKILEISSGTGRHIMHFATHFPNAIFQPSEIDTVSIHSINMLIDKYKPNGEGSEEVMRAVGQRSFLDEKALSPNRKVGEVLLVELRNVRVPLFIDVSEPVQRWFLPADFGAGSVDVLLNINMIHVSSNAAIDGLFWASRILLKANTGLLLTYGAYAVGGHITPESNVEFDRTIRQINPEWGLRDIAVIEEKAINNDLRLSKIFDMPANNKLLIFERQNH
ncbi:UPF0585 protein C16orf13 -like protein [Toxocara canis]|uniref:UPF0585 protein C16orf13-like protein n=1 Tax=Toxocara canis TaxID=6265 RepID=A0A0B2V0C4_TOXCA|nr:UPF0585 protein C16orf13 -like protein [Toxocara canis]